MNPADHPPISGEGGIDNEPTDPLHGRCCLDVIAGGNQSEDDGESVSINTLVSRGLKLFRFHTAIHVRKGFASNDDTYDYGSYFIEMRFYSFSFSTFNLLLPICLTLQHTKPPGEKNQY